MPYISVIVPVYNTEKELPRCIDSILGQSFADFELLLVNDGSTDGSGAICDDYAAKDSRVRVFHKENGGVSSARNRGLDNAVGEMVVFVDSDDQIEQGYFANAIDTDADIYYYHRMLSDGHFDSVIPCGVYYDEDLKNYLIENSDSNLFRMSTGFIFKKDIIDKYRIRFHECIHFGEDRVFTMEYYIHCKSIKVSEKPYYVYNRCYNWDNKFVVSFRDAEIFMDSFMDVYDRFPLHSSKIVSTAGFIVQFIDRREKNLRLRQALSKPFLRYRKALFDEKPMGFKVRYYISRVLATFVHV